MLQFVFNLPTVMSRNFCVVANRTVENFQRLTFVKSKAKFCFPLEKFCALKVSPKPSQFFCQQEVKRLILVAQANIGCHFSNWQSPFNYADIFNGTTCWMVTRNWKWDPNLMKIRLGHSGQHPSNLDLN